MGSPSVSDSSQKELNVDLVDVGNQLLKLRSSSVDELLILLEKAESILAKVWQQPPKSTAKSLVPIMKALITDELLWHADEEIQIAVASCMNELTRISAPDMTYPAKIMKAIFQIFMVSLKQLSSPGNFDKPLKILEYMAKVKSCLLMMDIDSDETIVEMFQLFLNTIRSNHPFEIFDYMQMIMTLVIKESDEISFDLMEPLLASVKMDNKNISPVSWELGITIFGNCATKICRYLREDVKKRNLDVNDYADIVKSLFQDTFNGNTPNGKKTMDSSTAKPTKTKKRKNLAPEKEKKRKTPLFDTEVDLVNSRIQVWWPMDETFYPGTVTAFDPTTKKHTIKYDDDEIENLDLKNEVWKPSSGELESKLES